MPQINLLKQNINRSNNWASNIPNIIAKILWAVFVLVVLYYGWIYFSSVKVSKEIVSTQEKINTEKQAILSMDKRNEVLTRQLQLKDLDGAIAKHIYWSQLFPELARVTLKTANYSSLTAGTDGDLVLRASVPTIGDLDKFTQIFDSSSFNQNFSNVRIGGFSKAQDASGSSAVTFDVRIQYDPSIVQYKEKK
ncbi:MAG: hypothetical protein HY918_03900 [Candidatus Doudnabacteria bacterium]|nr:hypothetical protein [Candidatus Doudnabacteria bacterium]